MATTFAKLELTDNHPPQGAVFGKLHNEEDKRKVKNFAYYTKMWNNIRQQTVSEHWPFRPLDGLNRFEGTAQSPIATNLACFMATGLRGHPEARGRVCGTRATEDDTGQRGKQTSQPNSGAHDHLMEG